MNGLADQDNPLGERYLAEMYFKGRGTGRTMQRPPWLRQAAEQGDAQSEYNPPSCTQGEVCPEM
jgi:TPR repeat protein